MTELYATFEAKKDGLQQRQDGLWKLTLTIHPDSMPSWLLTAPMGQRIGAAALHEIGDDEKPTPASSKGGTPDFDSGNGGLSPSAGTKEKSEGERAVTRAALLCGTYDFQKWIINELRFVNQLPGSPTICEDNAAETLRRYCGVSSRAELAVNSAARKCFETIETDYRYKDARR